MGSVFDRIQSSGRNLNLSEYREVECIDMHTGGEPLRVVLSGGPKLKSNTILGCRNEMRESHDAFRTALMWEPRGHADMYGALLIPPERKDSAFGVLFLHNEGYSTMCGHATIALGRLAVELGWIKPIEPHTEFKMDAPCGQLDCFVHVKDGKVISSGFYNVPSFAAQLDATVTLADGTSLDYDLAFGGAYYAFVRAEQFARTITPDNTSFFTQKGMEIKDAVARTSQNINHPEYEDLGFLYGTIFIEDSDTVGIHSRNVCMFAEGEIDRSPTGSGISARAAIHKARGQLKVGEEILIESILRSTMAVSIDREVEYHGYSAVIPKVQGQSWITGRHTFLIDNEDPFKRGFLLK